MLDTPSHNLLYSLLGLSHSSPKFKELIPADLEPSITKLSNYIYHAYKPLGISLCFIPKKDDLILDAIDIYNGRTPDEFSPCTINNLPCKLHSTMQAHEIVSNLGEPDRKGGGGQSRLPCWIEYKFSESSGILIQLHGFEWEDREMGWTSFVLF
ncbi:hypothetical protein BD408DRAFT_407925 [Parasitella parasitica]|nr:hypothetical protein BD408DRAFT_407925 [Parasitella parasitica]